jgi:hypothetical protein
MIHRFAARTGDVLFHPGVALPRRCIRTITPSKASAAVNIGRLAGSGSAGTTGVMFTLLR